MIAIGCRRSKLRHVIQGLGFIGTPGFCTRGLSPGNTAPALRSCSSLWAAFSIELVMIACHPKAPVRMDNAAIPPA